jgi:hypothetical protein
MQQLKIKKLPPVLLLLLGTLFLIGCVPRSSQENTSPSIPFRVTLLPLANNKVNVNEVVQIDMEIRNTTTQPIKYVFADWHGWIKHLFVHHYDENGNPDSENDLSIKNDAAGVRIYPSFYQESRQGQLETTFSAGAVDRAKFKVVFSQAGTYFVQGAMHIQLPSGIPNILTEVIILSPPILVAISEKK